MLSLLLTLALHGDAGAAGCGESQLVPALAFRRAHLLRELDGLPSPAESARLQRIEKDAIGAARLFEASGLIWLRADVARAQRDTVLMELSYLGPKDARPEDLSYPAFAPLLLEHERLGQWRAQLSRLERDIAPPRVFERAIGRARVRAIGEVLEAALACMRRCYGFWLEMNVRANGKLSTHPFFAVMTEMRGDVHDRLERLRQSLTSVERRKTSYGADALDRLAYESRPDRFGVLAYHQMTPLVLAESRQTIAEITAEYRAAIDAEDARVRAREARTRRNEFRVIARE